MIVLKELRAENAGPYERLLVPLDAQGLVFLCGENEMAGGTSNGCLVGHTLIDCPRDLARYPRGIPISDLVGQRPWVYCWLDGRITIRRASRVMLTKRRARVVRVQLTKYATALGGGNGGSWIPPLELVGTPDHLVMLSDGRWRPLGKLRPGDSLCSLYRRSYGKYSQIYWTGKAPTEAVEEHQLVCAETCGPRRSSNYDAHHLDHNQLNHTPANLEWKLHSKHLSDHTRKRNLAGTAGWQTTGKHPRGMAGKRHRSETKKRIGQTLTGRVLPASHRLKISEALRGRKFSAATLRRMRLAAQRRCERLAEEKVNHTVVSLDHAGYADVYDMTVPGVHNFVANGVVVHNSGKTYIFDLINDVLLGETAKGEKKDALISWERPDRGLLQEIEFSVHDADYLVRKARKHHRYGTTLQIFRDGALITKKGMVAAERQLREEILGVTLEEFYNCTYLTKNFTHLLITGKPAERDLYLTQLFGLGIYHELAALVTSDLKAIQQQLEETRDLEAARRALEQRLRELPRPAERAVLQTRAARVAELAAQVQRLERQHEHAVVAAKARARREALDEQLAQLHLPTPQPSLRQVRRKLQRAEFRLQAARNAALFAAQRTRLTDKLATLAKVAKYDDTQLRTALAKLETRLERLAEQLPLARRRHELERNAQRLRRQVLAPEQAATKLARTRQQLGQVDAQIADLRTRIKVLQRAPHAACPTCGHRLPDKDHFVAQLHQQCTEARQTRAELARDQQRLDAAASCATRLHEIEHELRALPAQPVPQLEAKLQQARTLLQKVRRALTLIEQHTQLTEQLRGLPAAVAEDEDPRRLDHRLRRLRQLEHQLLTHTQLTEKLAQLPAASPTEIDAGHLHRRLQRYHDRLYVARRQLDEATRQRTEWRQVRRELATQVQQLEQLRSVRQMEQALTGLTVAFGRKGLRLQRLRAIIKVIAEHLPLYLNMLFAERRLRFEVTEKEEAFSLAAFRNKHRVHLEGFSRGEKARLTLALLLATRLATPSSKHTNALFLDEVFDAIDERGYEGVFTTLRHVLAAGDITSIFLISQNSGAARHYKQYIDQNWLCRKNEKGTSQLILNVND